MFGRDRSNNIHTLTHTCKYVKTEAANLVPNSSSAIIRLVEPQRHLLFLIITLLIIQLSTKIDG